MSFSDKPLLASSAEQSSIDAANASAMLHQIDAYTEAFFDKYLRGSKNTLLDQSKSADPQVSLDRYNIENGNVKTSPAL